jgi:ubiquinone/menaquinone biosynthesis C-methylase UbiE
MDNVTNTNRERWNALARANVESSQPFLDFTRDQATKYICRHGALKDLNGKKVLCLASGGGQDSVAFGLLGADVTVLDPSDVQLERDRQAAQDRALEIKTVQGDMRDLSTFPDSQFDVVWQVYSINFIPSVDPVFREVWRVLKPSGVYFLQFAKPFAIGID